MSAWAWLELNSLVGCPLKIKSCLVSGLLVSVAWLASCSGPPQPPCTSNCPVTGNATVSLTLFATPLIPPPDAKFTNLLSFSVTVVGVSLTPATGAAVNIPLNTSTYVVDLTKLQSDSAFLATIATVPAGTYNSMTVSLSTPVVTYCTQTSGVSGCAAGSVKTVTGGAAAPQITTTPFPLALIANQQTGIGVNFSLANALTVTPSTQVVTAVNLAAANVLSAKVLPPTSSSLAVGQLDFVEDVTGLVTAINASAPSVTVKTATRGSITAFANSSTVYSPNCTNFTFSSCVQLGQIASLDTVLKTDGTFTLLEYDPLAKTTGDWIEGIVPNAASSPTAFRIVTNDLVVSSSSSLIGGSANTLIGQPVNITLVTPAPFTVDTKGLTVPVNNFSGTDASILSPGETVSLHVTGFTAVSGAPIAANVDTLILRFTRVTGTVNAAAPPTFSIQSLPTFFGLTVPVTVQLSTGSPSTNYDGIANANGLTASQTVSIRALYFGPTSTPTPFSAAKVRMP